MNETTPDPTNRPSPGSEPDTKRKRNRRMILIGGGLVALVIIAVLAFGVFGVHTLFIDKTVDESGPFFDESTAPAASSAAAEPETAPQVDETDAPAENTAEATAAPASTAPPSPPVTEAPAIVTLVQGDFAGADDSHDVSGQALVLNDGSEQRFLRFENFESTNGPDLKVYLRAANGDHVSLGELKGNIGNQNYEIPTDVDLDVYNTVQIWCQRFSVSFGQAVLA